MLTRLTKALALAVLLTVTSIAAAAQGNMSDSDRQRWLRELRTYKHEYLAKELSLTRDQQAQFFPLYDEMETRIEDLNSQTRDLETRLSGDLGATDTELRQGARTLFELKQAEGQIELEYFDRFQTILKPRQMLMLKSAERKFTSQLVKRHRRIGRPAPQPAAAD